MSLAGFRRKTCLFAFYGTPEGTFPFRYLSEKKLKQENKNGNQNNNISFK